MSSSTKHAYKVVETTIDAENVEVGTILVQNKHVRKHHEPNRIWEFASRETGEPTGYIVAKHIGEFEKVKEFLADEQSEPEQRKEV